MGSEGKTRRGDRSGVRPEIRALLEREDLLPPLTPEQETPAARRAAALLRLPALWGPPETVARVDEISIPVGGGAEVRARIYRPEGALGTVYFLHGGGWALGDLDTHEGPTRRFANATPANVVSLEYRKAPEFPFPTPLDDAKAGLDWLVANGAKLGLDTARIVIAGESAGANIAGAVARHARDRGLSLAGQVLIYPVADTTMDTASYADFGEGFYLAADGMRWFVEQYFADPAHRDHPDAALLRAPAAALANLAPAHVLTAEFDPLRDEGRAYAARLIEAGNDVTFREWKGVVHGFWLMNAISPVAGEVIADVGAWIRGRWA